MSRTRDPNPHVTDNVTIQPKKNCVPDQHYVFRGPEMLKEYVYNKRPRYDLNVNVRADDHSSSIGLMPVLQESFRNTYTKDRWTRLQTRRHLGANVTDDSFSSFMPFQVRHYVPEALAAPDDGVDIIYNGKLMIGGQGEDTRSYPNKGV